MTSADPQPDGIDVPTPAEVEVEGDPDPADPADPAAPGTSGVSGAVGTPTERARALLRAPRFRRLWRVQAVDGLADRLGLLVLLVLTVDAVAQRSVDGTLGGSVLGGGYRALLFALVLFFAVRLAAGLLVGAALLEQVHGLLGRLDRRWTMIGSAGLRGALLGVAPFWSVWTPASAWIWLLVSVAVGSVAERVWTVLRESVSDQLLPGTGSAAFGTPGLPATGPGLRAAADQRAVQRHLDRWTGYLALPLAAVLFVLLILIGDGLAQGVHWLSAHQVTVAAFGSVLLSALAVALLYPQALPDPAPATGARAFRPHSPLEHLRAPADRAAGGLTAAGADGKGRAPGRTGSSVLFSFAATGTAAALAGAAAVAYPHAHDLGAGPSGFGLLVLALTGGLLLGQRAALGVLPVLTRRRLLPLAVGTAGLALILGGLVRDYVLALVLFTLAGAAGGVVLRTARALLVQETEEARQPLVLDHLHALLRTGVTAALVVSPLLGAAFGAEQTHGTTLTWDHGGAGLAVAVGGLALLVYAVVLFLRTDDRRGAAPVVQDVWQALRGGPGTVTHHAGTGYFIALEGGDGAGKSTQVQALAEWMRGKGHEVVVTREPGGSAVGQRLRAMLLDTANTGITHRAEALMYAADRAEHVETVILPALRRGAVVLTDRYQDSSIAYQGAGRDLAAAEVARLNRWATGGLVPDLTVVLDVRPEDARQRFTETLDRIESEPTEFHERVRAGFLALAAADPARYLVVDAGQAAPAVTGAIRHRLDRELPLSEQEKAARAEQERLAREAEARRAEEEARRKAEQEKAERERQAVLERLRVEEAEREKARQVEEERRAAEAARIAAENARRLAAEEAARRAAEDEQRRAAEAEVQRRRAAEEEERREVEAERRRAAVEAAEAEQRRIESELAAAATAAAAERERSARRAEERQRAEEALRRAEQTRTTAVPADAADAPDAPVDSDAPVDPAAETAVLPPVPPLPSTPPAAGPVDDAADTAVLPVIRPDGTSAAEDETAVLPRVPAADADAADEADVTGDAADADAKEEQAADGEGETAVLPRVPADTASTDDAEPTDAEPTDAEAVSAEAGIASVEDRKDDGEDGPDSTPGDGGDGGTEGPDGDVSPSTPASGPDAEPEGDADAASGSAASRTPTAPDGDGRTVPAPGRPADEAATAVLPAVPAPSQPKEADGGAADETMVLPRISVGSRPPVVGGPSTRPVAASAPVPAGRSAVDETVVLPPVPAAPRSAPEAPQEGSFSSRLKRVFGSRRAADSEPQPQPQEPPQQFAAQSPTLPRAWREAAPRSEESVQHQGPDWLFGSQPTPPPAAAQHPQVDAPAAPRPSAPRGGRPEWAEETPLDDPLSLTDELLGTRQEWAHWEPADEDDHNDEDNLDIWGRPRN